MNRTIPQVEAYSGSSTASSAAADSDALPVFEAAGLNVYYGDFHAVKDVTIEVKEHEITAFIGPSGCGKSTVLRCFNRMNDLIAGTRLWDTPGIDHDVFRPGDADEARFWLGLGSRPLVLFAGSGP